jgi:hypothetical protein
MAGDQPVTRRTTGATRPWVLALGAGLTVANAFWLVHMEMGGVGGSAGPYPTTFSLFANVVCVVLAVRLLNALLAKRWPKAVLRQEELLALYVMLAVASAIASVDMLDVLVPMMGHATRFATPENGWATQVLPLLPKAATVANADALKGWYEGGTTLYEWNHVAAWAGPVALWTGFICLLLFTMLCLNLVLRQRWIEEERLSYPVVQLPLELTDPESAALRTRTLWLGAALAGGLDLWNGVAVHVPSLPALNVRVYDLLPYITSRPWNAMGWTPISFYPFAIGLAYLLPLELLFSCWFFYWFYKLQRVAVAALGWDRGGSALPYVNQQVFGAYIGVAMAALWVSRGYLRRAVSSPPSPGDPISPRLAALGAALGFAGLCAFFVALGLPVWLAAAAFLLYFAVALGVTRMRAELGPPAHDLHFAGPDVVLTTAFGTAAFAPKQLAVLTLFFWFNRAYRSLPMPHQLEAMKMTERRGLPPSAFLPALLLAAPLGSLAGFWAHLHMGYSMGASSKLVGHMVSFGWEAFGRLDTWLRNPQGPDLSSVAAMGAGCSFTLFLQAMSLRFVGWPFHPLGYALAGSWSMNTIWLPTMLAWAAKSLVCRYGGLRAHRRALPFFLGLILGDYVVGCGWGLIGWALGIPYYSFQQ